MPSEKHKLLIDAICKFAIEKYETDAYDTDAMEWIVCCDKPDCDKPPSILGYRPDFFAISRKGRCIIGEAKTPLDLISERSCGQIKAYIRYLYKKSLTKKEGTVKAVLIIAVPLASIGVARQVVKNVIRKVSAEASIRWHVIEQTGWDSGAAKCKSRSQA